MKYLSFIRHSEKYRESTPPPALMEAMGKFVERSLKDGTLVETGGLLPSKDGEYYTPPDFGEIRRLFGAVLPSGAGR